MGTILIDYEQLLNTIKENSDLRKQLALTEKALELACEVVNDKYAKPFGNNADYTEYFKEQAKEMMKSE